MAELEIRLGRAGSGKSARIVADIARAVAADPLGPPILWIVPDDVAYAAERRLMAAVPSVLRAEVITLRRLAERLLNFAGGDRARPITMTGKRLLLASVFAERVPELGPLRREEPTPGYFDVILQAFDELLEQRIDLSALALDEGGAKSPADRTLTAKLRDLAVLYGDYRTRMAAGGYRDPSTVLSDAMEALGAWPELANASVYVDEFRDLTPQTLQFLIALAGHAAHSVIALPASPTWLESAATDSGADVDALLPPLAAKLFRCRDEAEVYAPHALRALDDLRKMAEDARIPVRIVVQDQALRFADCSDLAHLERHLFAQSPQVAATPTSLRIARAGDPRAEVEGVAMDIRRRMALEGVAYRDVAVIVPDLSAYGAYIDEIFARYQIPRAMDVFPSLATYPLAKFLLACIAATEGNFAIDAMVRLIKTDFSQVSDRDADWLETYLRTHEVAGRTAWYQEDPWSFAVDAAVPSRRERASAEDERADRLRRRVMAYFALFDDAFARAELTPRRVADAVWQLFLDVGAKRTVAQWMVNEDGRQSPLEASLHEQAWQRLVALLEDLSSVSPDVPLEKADLLHILQSDIARQELSTIPAGVDEVLVTDLSRAHAWSAPVVYVIGWTSHAIPRRIRTSGLWQDEERLAFLRRWGRPLGETTEERQLAERDRSYFALTRATRQLMISYPQAGPDGREQHPSMWIERIAALFAPGPWRELEWRADADGGSEAEPLVFTPRSALDWLVRTLQFQPDDTAPGALRAVVRWFLEHDAWRDKLEQALQGFTHDLPSTPLPDVLAAQLYGQPFTANVHQLEAFAACPYRHFVEFGLRVEPEEPIAGSARAKGTLLHAALDAFVRRHMADPAWRDMSDDEAVRVMRATVDELLEAPEHVQWRRDARRQQQAAEVRTLAERAAVVLTRHARFGQFQPTAVELAFGTGPDADLPAFEVPLPNGARLLLRGRVDRVDVFSDGDLHAFRIIDYKSSQLDIDLTKVAHGLRLQLPIYAAAITAHSEQLFGRSSRPAAILYLPVVDKVETKSIPDAKDTAFLESLRQLRARGLMVADPAIVGAMDIRLIDGADSELFAKVYTKQKTLMPYAPALAEEDWRRLVGRALAHAREIGERILAGEIAPSPYRIGHQESACTTCSNRAICHFDAAIHVGRMRKLEKLPRQRVGEAFAPYSWEGQS